MVLVDPMRKSGLLVFHVHHRHGQNCCGHDCCGHDCCGHDCCDRLFAPGADHARVGLRDHRDLPIVPLDCLRVRRGGFVRRGHRVQSGHHGCFVRHARFGHRIRHVVVFLLFVCRARAHRVHLEIHRHLIDGCNPLTDASLTNTGLRLPRTGHPQTREQREPGRLRLRAAGFACAFAAGLLRRARGLTRDRADCHRVCREQGCLRPLPVWRNEVYDQSDLRHFVDRAEVGCVHVHEALRLRLRHHHRLQSRQRSDRRRPQSHRRIFFVPQLARVAFATLPFFPLQSNLVLFRQRHARAHDAHVALCVDPLDADPLRRQFHRLLRHLLPGHLRSVWQKVGNRKPVVAALWRWQQRH